MAGEMRSLGLRIARAALGAGMLALLAMGMTPVPVWADRIQLCVVIESLVRNSLEALDGVAAEGTSGRGRIEIEAHGPGEGSASEAAASVPMSRLVIRDTGRGLSDHDREHLFDPFYSGREAGRGLGLGLSKVWRIMELHGGQVLVNSRPARGTTFTLVFAG